MADDELLNKMISFFNSDNEKAEYLASVKLANKIKEKKYLKFKESLKKNIKMDISKDMVKLLKTCRDRHEISIKANKTKKINKYHGCYECEAFVYYKPMMKCKLSVSQKNLLFDSNKKCPYAFAGKTIKEMDSYFKEVDRKLNWIRLKIKFGVRYLKEKNKI